MTEAPYVTPAGPLRTARARRWRLHFAPVVLSLALCAYLGVGLDATRLRDALQRADAVLVVVALLLVGGIPLLAAERWQRACRAAGLRLARGFAFPVAYAGLFAGQFLPSAIGTDAVRLALLWRQGCRLSAAIVSLAVDRGCGVGALVALLAAGLPIVSDRLPAGSAETIGAFVATAVVTAGALLWADRRWLPAAARRGMLGRVLALPRAIREALATFEALAALALGAAIHLVSITSVWLLAQAFGHQLPLTNLVSITAVAIFLAMLPLSFNGWGIREGALMAGLSLLGVPREDGLLIAFLYGAAGTLATLPGAAAWWRLRTVAATPAVTGDPAPPSAGRGPSGHA